MNALKNSLRTLVALIALLVCSSSVQGFWNKSKDSDKVRKAAKRGDAKAQTILGLRYGTNGMGVPQDYAEAVKWWRLSAEQGDSDAQFWLGVCYANGYGVPKDDAEAVKWYRLAVEQGHAKAQNNLGLCYERGRGVPKDDAEAVKWYRKAAEQGNAKAQYNLGFCYDNGLGVPENKKMAKLWFTLAHNSGSKSASSALRSLKSVDLPPEYEDQKKSVERSVVAELRNKAEQGYAIAQHKLGRCYLDGDGVPQDYAEAVKWWRLSAEQGYLPAKNSLGAFYHNGRGVPKDDAEAVKWWRLAADLGYAVSQNNLGLCYANGTGVPQDYVLAYMWFNLAVASGDEDATRIKLSRENLSKKMTPEQIAEAQKLSREWKPKGQ